MRLNRRYFHSVNRTQTYHSANWMNPMSANSLRLQEINDRSYGRGKCHSGSTACLQFRNSTTHFVPQDYRDDCGGTLWKQTAHFSSRVISVAKY